MLSRSIRLKHLLSLLIVFVVIGIMQPATPAQGAPDKQTAVKTTAAVKAKSAAHWFRKGALCATYGNDQAAISYFKKTISINPGHDGAHFSQGVSYGQLGEHAKALAAIDRAIALDPKNGHYYYGRGRVQLISGHHDQAMLDFKKAAELGDEDAQLYLGEISAPKTIKLK